MSEWGKNALNPCDTYITSGLGCFSYKGRTNIARGSFHDKSKPIASENRELLKTQAFRGSQDVPHQVVPLLTVAGQGAWAAAGGSQNRHKPKT